MFTDNQWNVTSTIIAAFWMTLQLGKHKEGQNTPNFTQHLTLYLT